MFLFYFLLVCLVFWGFVFHSFPLRFVGKIKLIPATYQIMAEFNLKPFCDFYHLSSVRSKQSKNPCMYFLAAEI